MITKEITYDDLNDETVTETLNFAYTKLELLEMEIKYPGGIQGLVDKLGDTTVTKDAYDIFKDILLSSYGKRSADGRRFEKTAEIRSDFEASPAMSEFIFELLQDPTQATQFIEGCFPKKLIAQVKAEAAAEFSMAPTGVEVAPPASAPKSYSRDELLALSDEEFLAVAGSDPLKMSVEHLQVAMQRKTREG